MWAGVDDDSNTLDDSYDIDEIDTDTYDKLVQECKLFQEENAELLAGLDLSQCGHDFLLSRNYHGTGFWDRELGEVEAYVGYDRKFTSITSINLP